MSKELIERAQNSFADDAADRVLISDMADRIERLEAERDLHHNRLASLLFSDFFKPEVTAGMIQDIAAEYTNAIAERDELKTLIQNFLCAWDSCRSSGEWPVRRLEELRAALAATPAQSLARLRNQAIEKCAVELDGNWDTAAGIIRAMKEPE